MASPEDTSAKLDAKGIKRVQGIVGALLFFGREVNNKLLVALSAISAQKSAATENTNTAITQLLDYVATYSYNGLFFRESDKILAAHLDAWFLNEPKVWSRLGAHVFLSEKVPTSPLNGDVLSIVQIINYPVASAAEYELAALYITAKTMVPLRNTLVEMGWPQI